MRGLMAQRAGEQRHKRRSCGAAQRGIENRLYMRERKAQDRQVFAAGPAPEDDLGF